MFVSLFDIFALSYVIIFNATHWHILEKQAKRVCANLQSALTIWLHRAVSTTYICKYIFILSIYYNMKIYWYAHKNSVLNLVKAKTGWTMKESDILKGIGRVNKRCNKKWSNLAILIHFTNRSLWQLHFILLAL